MLFGHIINQKSSQYLSVQMNYFPLLLKLDKGHIPYTNLQELMLMPLQQP